MEIYSAVAPNYFDFWQTLSAHWNWVWFIVIVTLGIGRAGTK